jgi:hypothetical protein
MCGFGLVQPLPGIVGWHLNTAITLPVGVEAYGAYALGAWLTPGTPAQARTFARRSAIGALVLGMTGQVVYHLLAASGAQRAPWPVVVLVSCLPVVTLGFGAALTHLLRKTDAQNCPPRGGITHPDYAPEVSQELSHLPVPNLPPRGEKGTAEWDSEVLQMPVAIRPPGGNMQRPAATAELSKNLGEFEAVPAVPAGGETESPDRKVDATPGSEPDVTKTVFVTPVAPSFTDAESAAAEALAWSIAGGNPLTPNALQNKFRLTRAEATKVRNAVLAEANGRGSG